MAITINGKPGVTQITELTVGSSADLASIINDESGTGVLAFTNTPTFTTPILGTASATAIELGHASDTTIARVSSGVVSIEGVNIVTTSSTDTLTNKTLTAPVISSITNTGTLTLPTSTGTVALTSDITITGSSKLSDFAATTSAELAGVISDETGTGALAFATSPVLTTPILKSPEERLTVSATAATGTVNYDALTQGVLYYTTDASGDWTLNVRGDGSTTLNDSLAVNDSITIVFLVTQGATAYYSSALTIDGSAVTPKFITGTAFSAGNASSIDSYVYTIIKTGSATFTVLASQTKFA